jgi:hypothetical protein
MSHKLKQQNVYVMKAMWHSTAKLFRVTAKDEDEAQVKAERAVLRMEGGIRCLEVKLMGKK